MSYLSEDDEVRVVTQTTGVRRPAPVHVLGGEDILAFQEYVRAGGRGRRRRALRRAAGRRLAARAAVRQLDFVDKWVKWGAGLRASQALILGAKARALIHGRYHVSVKDIQALAAPILRHRVIPNFYAEAEGITSDIVVERLLGAVPPPASGL